MADVSADRKLAAALNKVAKYAYWILGLILISGISYVLYERLDRQITSVLFFLAGVILLYFYYVKWFVIPEQKPAWSPYATPCPDYLTVTSNNANIPGEPYKCYDFVGVSRRPDGLKKSSAHTFDTTQNDPRYYFNVDPREDKESLQQRVLAQGLSWNSLFGDA